MRVHHLRLMILLLAAGAMFGCGSDEPVTPGGGDDGPDCDTIAWDLLLSADEANLSSYRLFASDVDPTSGPSDTGMPYDLNTALFTDYASKYRFVFMPCDSAATYVADESFVFPIGTAITKTFAMPANTAARGIENETLIETRLLIKRETGWVALPYVWLADGSDAVLNTDGEAMPMSVTHNGTDHNFTYAVPSQLECAGCHTLADALVPIGPKARNLNGVFDYGLGPENQLSHWQAARQLEGLPSDLNTIDTMPVFTDATDPASLADEAERNRYAKAYLDINCAHCHRPEGSYGNRAPYLEYWRSIDTAVTADNHGICRTILPGDASASGMHIMMQLGLMPKIGTSLVHEEGLALLDHWIDNMPYTCP